MFDDIAKSEVLHRDNIFMRKLLGVNSFLSSQRSDSCSDKTPNRQIDCITVFHWDPSPSIKVRRCKDEDDLIAYNLLSGHWRSFIVSNDNRIKTENKMNFMVFNPGGEDVYFFL